MNPHQETATAPDNASGACRCLDVPNQCGCLDTYLIPELRSGKPFTPSPSVDYASSTTVTELLDGRCQSLDSLTQGVVLNLQLPDSIGVRIVLDLRTADQTTGAGSAQRQHLIVNVLGNGNINHKNSSSVGAARTVRGSGALKPTVGDTTDKVAGPFAATRVSGLQDGAVAVPPTAAVPSESKKASA